MTATETAPDDVPACLAAVAARVALSARDVGRDPASVSLVAVSKTHAADVIAPALDAGHRVFGENRVQESKGKWPELRERFPGVELHLIGPLQSNKAREAVELFDVIETVDRPKIAEALAAEIARAGRAVKLFVEVNTGAEPQKAGILPGDADAFLKHCRGALGLDVAGLMCIPPADEQASPHFALLAKIAAANGVPALSMGMSSDFELGIQLGATHVRVGTAIFGARPPLR
ncbi:YggS family pyridoxal phosphate-dependent enzyme [Lichenibacterium dinghuense]|uniref:YggS family pyridoxal phosphate-dependent enzyme n=1 Tax=Lichenibacterium dinghuense TaxID=2895977 RepID=UPI001EFF8F66|nr:YggS family pyridoxal phosphate-dependent enzyme [Lichenibacterium sp. 6Y81]